MQEKEINKRDEIYSNTVRAGKRTYFFDVKTTKSDDYYLTVTESKKRFNKDQGKFYYEKHKVFLYKEDFEKFINGLQNSIDYIKQLYADRGQDITQLEKVASDDSMDDSDDYADIDFDDLDPEHGSK